MARVTGGQLQQVTGSIEHLLRTLGMIGDGDRMVIEIGSKTYGRAFRIYRVGEGSTGLSDAPLHLGDGFLGLTSTDALRSLRMIRCTLSSVVEARRKADGLTVIPTA